VIVIDTSVLVAILAAEPDAPAFQRLLARTTHRAAPASCYLEAVMVASRRRDGRAALDKIVADYAIDLLPIDEPIVRRAADAFERYGKGRHPAGLNFGDCLSYAAAMQLAAPLVFKGGDFARTDVAIAA
jgi:ribonuclease VapC